MKNIAPALKELGLTQQQFADEIGQGLRTVHGYATGKYHPHQLLILYLNMRLWMKRRGFKISDLPD